MTDRSERDRFDGSATFVNLNVNAIPGVPESLRTTPPQPTSMEADIRRSRPCRGTSAPNNHIDNAIILVS